LYAKLPQAIEWLKVHIKAAGQNPEVLPMHDPHFQNSLELAVRFGKVRGWCQVHTLLDCAAVFHALSSTGGCSLQLDWDYKTAPCAAAASPLKNLFIS
jgi:hypothetical protein